MTNDADRELAEMAREFLEAEREIVRLNKQCCTGLDMLNIARAELERETFSNGYWEREYESCRKEREELAARARDLEAKLKWRRK